MDEVAENSDELMERYLEGEEISHEEIVTALKKGSPGGHLFPVTCGVATKNLGTDRLLEALVEDLPSPAMRGAGRGARRRRRGRRDRPGPDGDLVAYVFKTLADPYTGRINLLRVYSGVLRSDSQVTNVTRGAKERIGQLVGAARQGHGAGRRARPGRHRRGREAQGDAGRRRAGEPSRAGISLPAARPAGAGDGVRLRAEDQGRRGEGGDGDPPARGGGPDARRPPRPADRASRSSPG